MKESTSVFLKLLEERKTFLDYISKEIPNKSAEWYSYHSSTKCSCKNKIINFLEENEDLVKNILNSFNKIEKFDYKANLEKIKKEKDSAPKYMGGKIFVIQESQYEEFILDIKNQRWIYKGLNIYPLGNEKIKIYFY